MIPQARPRSRGGTDRGVALVIAALLTAACGSTPDGSEDPAGDTKIVGSAESVDDVGDQDRTPMSDRTLLVLPQAEADRLWDLVEHVPSNAELPYVGGLLGPADVEPWHLAPIDDGRFGLEVPDGDYLVCLLSGEFVLNGCAQTTVAGAMTWDVAHGEGGFELSR